MNHLEINSIVICITLSIIGSESLIFITLINWSKITPKKIYLIYFIINIFQILVGNFLFFTQLLFCFNLSKTYWKIDFQKFIFKNLFVKISLRQCILIILKFVSVIFLCFPDNLLLKLLELFVGKTFFRLITFIFL